MACKHTNPEWHLAGCNEDGWRCGDCDKKLGFRPDLDRNETSEKVGLISLLLHEQEYIHISNSTGGDVLTAAVVKRCHADNVYDQQSIIRFILEEEEPDHSKYWQDAALKEMTDARKQVRRIRTTDTPLFDGETNGTST